MQRKLLDILACPIDKHYPLQLFEFTTDGDIIMDGVLICEVCDRFYPIIEEIPVMLPDELRSKKEDVDFLTKWENRLPRKIIESGKPINLGAAPAEKH
jgi:uncharacterized protein YbaR (Trm112 family)